MRRLAAQRRAELAQVVPRLLEDPAVRVEAIRAMAAYNQASFAGVLLARYPDFSPAERTEALQRLASRPESGRALMRAIMQETVPRSDVPQHIVRQLLRVVGNGFLEVWGPVEGSAADARAYSRCRRLLSDAAIDAANVRNGRALFDRTCGACHRLYGEGGTLGPDLTGSNRANLDYLLSNVLNPSGDVADDYRMVVVTTLDGRTYAGTIAAETERQVRLRVVGQEAPVVISTADIQARDVTSTSMMPPGLFDALTESEVLDLVAYLRTAEPPRPQVGTPHAED